MVNRTRTNIVNVFNTLIQKYDIEKITVDKIIKEADLSKATFYRYFKDKYDVMNYNYKHLLDELSAPDCSNSYLDLYERLFKYGIKNWKFLQRALDTVGTNSFCEYIGLYSLEKIKAITEQNRNGTGLSETEKLQCDVFCIGVANMYRNWIHEKYPLNAAEAAFALYQIMPVTLRDYWWY